MVSCCEDEMNDKQFYAKKQKYSQKEVITKRGIFIILRELLE